MPRVSDLLDRMRPVGGPDDRLAAELEPGPVFAALTEVERECAELHDAALAQARERGERAARQAADLIRQARVDAEAERAETVARLRAQAQGELAELLGRAEEEARLVRARAAQRLPALVALVLAHVRVEMSALVGDENVPTPLRRPGDA